MSRTVFHRPNDFIIQILCPWGPVHATPHSVASNGWITARHSLWRLSRAINARYSRNMTFSHHARHCRPACLPEGKSFEGSIWHAGSIRAVADETIGAKSWWNLHQEFGNFLLKSRRIVAVKRYFRKSRRGYTGTRDKTSLIINVSREISDYRKRIECLRIE